MTVIVNYGAGNIRSVAKAFPGAMVSDDVDVVRCADRIVIPGVGAFAEAMSRIAPFIDALNEARDRGVPILGICLGMQIMAETGVEGGATKGLGWIPGYVLPLIGARVPHMGWNDVTSDEIENGSAYFCHSYGFAAAEKSVIATVDYDGPVACVVRDRNVMGVQFHPEKSQDYGKRFIAKWMSEGAKVRAA